jgi:hypothetical protein
MQLWLYLTIIPLFPSINQFSNSSLGIISKHLVFKLRNFKIPFIIWIECEMLTAYLTIISVFHNLDSPDVGMLAFLKDHDRVGLLGRLCGTEDGADIELGVVFHLLGMNDQANVNILFSCHAP